MVGETEKVFTRENNSFLIERFYNTVVVYCASKSNLGIHCMNKFGFGVLSNTWVSTVVASFYHFH